MATRKPKKATVRTRLRRYIASVRFRSPCRAWAMPEIASSAWIATRNPKTPRGSARPKMKDARLLICYENQREFVDFPAIMGPPNGSPARKRRCFPLVPVVLYECDPGHG